MLQGDPSRKESPVTNRLAKPIPYAQLFDKKSTALEDSSKRKMKEATALEDSIKLLFDFRHYIVISPVPLTR